MSENPNVLITEATEVVTDCERYLEAAEELIVGIPTRREAALKRIAVAEELSKEAGKELRRVLNNEDAGRAEVREAEREANRAGWNARQIRWEELGSDDLDLENRKSVARQLAALVREDAERRLREIAARSDTPEVRKTVNECKEEVATATHRLIRRFAEARSLLLDEVRSTRAEAHAVFDQLRNPPVDRSSE